MLNNNFLSHIGQFFMCGARKFPEKVQRQHHNHIPEKRINIYVFVLIIMQFFGHNSSLCLKYYRQHDTRTHKNVKRDFFSNL